MTENKKISLLAAMLININIIVGAGIFININQLASTAGPFGFMGYALSALILFPFVYCLAKLAQAHPVSGGIYVYSKNYIGSFAGFISGWCYFIGKAVSVALLASKFVEFVQGNVQALAPYAPLLLTATVIFTLIGLNILGLHIGGKIQYFFVSIKSIPLLFTFIFGVSLFNSNIFNLAQLTSFPLFSTIPIALYAMMGFETTCAIGHMIVDPEKNVMRTIVGSFLITATIFTCFQAVLYGVMGAATATSTEPLTTFAAIAGISPIVGKLISSLIFTAVIAGTFGILTSNCWNLFALGSGNHFPGKNLLCATSGRGAPYISLLLEGAVAVVMLAISRNQLALSSMSVFGVVFAFLMSAVAAYKATQKKDLKLPKWLPIIAIGSCAYILFLCLQKLQTTGVSIPYLLFLVGGIGVGLAKWAWGKKNIFK